MRLISFKIKQYKALKDVFLQFNSIVGPPYIHFFIGVNGSGKSTMLEALGLVFTRIMQDEVPGFYFELEYEINGVRISVEPMPAGYRDSNGRRRNLKVLLDENEKILFSIPDEYKPGRIVAYCSGVNNMMDDVLISSPKTSLESDLYDAYERENSAYIDEIMNHYRNLDINPRTLFLDAATSKLILPVIFSVLPFDIRNDDFAENAKNYFVLRHNITKRLGKFLPTAFSLVVDQEILKNMPETPQKNFFTRMLDIEKSKAYSWKISRSAPENEEIIVYLCTNYNEISNSHYNSGLQDCFEGNPYTLLSTLIAMHMAGVIKDVSFAFKLENCPELLDLSALSDGELMWLARMGLILISQKYCSKNNLFLFDEPDIHFNDDWNRDFISMVHAMCKGISHEFIIATHSTLILTDAFHKQIHLFETNPQGDVSVEHPHISTFAAQRERIDGEVFGTDAIGSYAKGIIDEMIKGDNPEKLLEDIGKVGPGYHRFRLYEHYYDLEEKK